ncbi:MAG: RNA polymerase Rpb6 [Bacteroidetes bacterium CG2_30_33_31]|nr:MAG: RNA polymerase Rpb6 [Bacteroidetes bacterium CG2_30_33_31]
MDYKKIVTDTNAITRNTRLLETETENIYESAAIISKRSEQIAEDLKAEFEDKISEFQSVNDSLEEVYENREQIEVARYYERLPKPTLLATWEFLNNKIYHRNPIKEESSDNF